MAKSMRWRAGMRAPLAGPDRLSNSLQGRVTLRWETPLEGPPSRCEALPPKRKYHNLPCESGLSRLNPAAASQTIKDDELNEPRRTKVKVYTPCAQERKVTVRRTGDGAGKHKSGNRGYSETGKDGEGK